MPDFIRARSVEQKKQRMQAIKNAVDELFMEKPYHEITLTTIAAKLDWTRVNLYKYISTKEEIFLELCADKRDQYYEALKAAFPEGCGYSVETFAEVWAGILNAHTDHLYYCDILSTIIETNVSVERLVAFKQRYYEKAYEIADLLGKHWALSRDQAYTMLLSIHFQAVGYGCMCKRNPLIVEALTHVKNAPKETNFRDAMQEFILMTLKHYI